MRFTPDSRDYRRIDWRPACDIDRSDVISMVGESARLARKFALGLSIGLIDVATGRACPTRVSRIDNGHWNSGKCSLVGQERPELEERPSAVHCTLTFTNRYPLANPSQVFDRDPALGVFGLRDNPLTDGVIHICTKSGLPSRCFLQMPFGRSGSNGLKIGTKLLHPLTHRLNRRSAVLLPIRIRGDVANPKVYAEPSLRLNRGSVRDLDRHVKKPFALAQYEVGLSAHALKSSAVVISAHKWDEDATVECQNRNTIQGLKAQDSLIIRDRSMRLEVWPFASVSFIGVNNLTDGAHGHLSRKSKAITKFDIVEMVELVFVGDLKPKCAPCEPLACFINALHGREEKGGLFIGGYQLDNCNELHKLEYNIPCEHFQQGRPRFLHRLKAMVSAREICP